LGFAALVVAGPASAWPFRSSAGGGVGGAGVSPEPAPSFVGVVLAEEHVVAAAQPFGQREEGLA
jgi:hypothetical protein